MKQVCFFLPAVQPADLLTKGCVENNLAYDALLTPNLSVEFSLGKKWTLDAQVGMNFSFMRMMPRQIVIRQGNGVIGLYNRR